MTDQAHYLAVFTSDKTGPRWRAWYAMTEEELRDMVSSHAGFPDEERRILDDVLSLRDRQLSEVMRPRPEVAALDGTPGWDSVGMSDRRMAESEDCVVLGYAATARRPDGSDYAAFCTSTWVRQGDDWQIVQHQQTVRAPS